MKKVILALAIASVSFVACNGSDDKAAPKTDSTVVAPKTDSTVAPVIDSTAAPKMDSTKK